MHGVTRLATLLYKLCSELSNISTDHYSYLCEQVDFNWQCSSCLFSYLLYHDVNNETLASSCVFEPGISIPMTSDILALSSNGIRLIHHNVQGLISKSTELCEWLHISQSVPINNPLLF